MDKVVSRRIVGVLVIVTLVLLMLPFLRSNEKNAVDEVQTTFATPTMAENSNASTPAIEDKAMETNKAEAATVMASTNTPADTAPQTAAPTAAPQAKLTVALAEPIANEIETALQHSLVKPQPHKTAATTPATTPGWVVQLGSFKMKKNADTLTKNIRSKGYKVFTYEIKRNGQTRVYVGPEEKRIAARELISKIKHDFNIQGVIVNSNHLDV